MRTRCLRVLWIWFFLNVSVSFAQKYPEGIWEGYDGEWKHVSQQLIALADATPADKFAWRPAAGIRSTSEVYMHIVMANFYLLSVTGPNRFWLGISAFNDALRTRPLLAKIETPELLPPNSTIRNPLKPCVQHGVRRKILDEPKAFATRRAPSPGAPASRGCEIGDRAAPE